MTEADKTSEIRETETIGRPAHARLAARVVFWTTAALAVLLACGMAQGWPMGWPVLRATAGALLAFFLSGYWLARVVSTPDRWLAAFFISVVGLFHAVFWVGLLSPPLSVTKVGMALLGLGVFPAILLRPKPPAADHPAGRDRSRFLRDHSLYLAPIAAVFLLLSARAVLVPLLGYDTPFRWNFLPLQMLRLGHFQFYPPGTGQDFETYFYVDGIPPLISFAYWWLYASAGTAAPSLTAMFVVPQFAALLWLTFRWGEHLHSCRAGLLAVTLLCACPLLFWSVLMGQETGLTALSLAGTLYFLSVAARSDDPLPATLVAAVAAATGALSREYGCAFIVCGLAAALWLRLPARSVLSFVVLSSLAAAPWYLRNWIATGNPFYSNPVGTLFPTNDVHVGILATYERVMRLTAPGERLRIILTLLAEVAPLQLTIGLAAVILQARRFGHLAFAFLVTVLLWMYSVGVTAGGYFWSVRVLSPALVVASVLAAVFLLQRRCPASLVTKGALGLVFAYAFTYELVVPEKPHATRVSAWGDAAFRAKGKEQKSARAMAVDLRPLHMKILSDNAYVHAALLRHGVQLVPVWSPAVAFLYDPGETPDRMRRRLVEQNVGGLLYRSSPRNMNSLYLSQFPFFARTQDLVQCRYVEGATFFLFPETASRASALCE